MHPINSNLIDLIKGIAVVPVALFTVMIPFSMWTGWNLLTIFLYWFTLIPFLAFYLPIKTSTRENHLLKSLSGLLFFFGFMVFMTYEHYNSDLYQVMKISVIFNLIFVSFTIMTRKIKERVFKKK